jgi:glycosyltransferase involved in cell wall biosynthesis
MPLIAGAESPIPFTTSSGECLDPYGSGLAIGREVHPTVAANVLFLHNSSNWIRGSENALLTLLRGVDREKINPFLLTGNCELAALAEANGIETLVHLMPEIMVDGAYVKLQFALWARTVETIVSWIKQRNVSLVYCNGGSTCQVGYYAAKKCGIPVICHVHSPYNRRYILLYRLHLASKVIFVSKAIEKSIREKQSFKAECEVVYNGVDVDRFQPSQARDRSWREKLSLPQDAIVFGQVSSLIHRKGIDILLRAFQLVTRQYPNSRLVLVGDGPQRADYVSLAKHLGVADLVSWTGNQADPLPFYQQVFDVNVLASRSDAFPLSVLEAAACALPNIGAMVDGIPESVLNEQTGLLFEAGNPGSLAEKMLALVAAPAWRKSLGEAGRRLIVERFSIERYCRSIEQVVWNKLSDG